MCGWVDEEGEGEGTGRENRWEDAVAAEIGKYVPTCLCSTRWVMSSTKSCVGTLGNHAWTASSRPAKQLLAHMPDSFIHASKDEVTGIGSAWCLSLRSAHWVRCANMLILPALGHLNQFCPLLCEPLP